MSIKIMLDAGHYDYQNQSPVYPQYYEAKQMWKLHLLLQKYLEQYGFEVDTTRADQTKNLSRQKRGESAKGYDLFISLHSDACNSETVDRATAFYAYDNYNNAKALAQKLIVAVGECMGVSGRIKTRKSTNGEWDYYTVMFYARKAGCPLYYIVEHSFHTNEDSAKWLMSDHNLDELAKAEAAAIAEYYGAKIKPKTEETIAVEMKQLSSTKNNRDAQVKTLQALLNGYGYNCGTVDGAFGAKTTNAVKAYQKAKKLTADGIVGKNTWNKLLEQ